MAVGRDDGAGTARSLRRPGRYALLVVRPRRFLPALVARTGTTAAGLALSVPLGLVLVAGPSLPPASATPGQVATPGGVTDAAAVPAEPDTAPLRVRIASMSKASLPRRGSITVRGTVTNRSEETWTTINLYTFVDSRLPPMTTPSALDAAMDVPYDAAVGERVVAGDKGLVDTLEPGETAPYVVKVPVSEFEYPPSQDGPADGVYWFGVHALGQSASSPRDLVADGRARTLLPSVPGRTEPIPATLLVPVTHPIVSADDGSLADEDRWERVLSPGGKLRELLALGAAGVSAGVPLTWLVDPALLDAIGRLAAGNAARSLAPTSGRATDEPAGTPSPDAEPTAPETTSGTPGADPDPEAEAVPDTPVALAARDWLAQAADVFGAGEVLTLPYGDVDAGATQRFAPALLDLALAQESQVAASLGIESRRVLAAPGGYVDADTVAATPDDTPLIVSDRFLEAPAPGVALLDGHTLIVTSAAAAQGSPGPGRSVTAVGLRQRLVAEAAVRALPDQADADDQDDADAPVSASGQPLVVVLPTDWNLDSAPEFFDGLQPDWVTFGPLAAATRTAPTQAITLDDFADVAQDRRQLELETVEVARELIAAGDTLQRVLVGNNSLGARVTEQALSTLSYSLRRQQRTARSSLALSLSWLDTRLGSVEVAASSGVTLSGDSGTFVVTLSNDLEESVRVSIAAMADPGLTIEPIEPIELAAESRTTVLLSVTTTTSRVHNVTLMVTDANGIPLGATDELPIRSVLVSDVIWVIIGVGVGTLFLAIGLRLRRRILASRRAATSPAATTP